MSRRYDLTNPGDTEALILHSDHSEGKAYLEKIQDVEPILERNKALQTHDGKLPMERGEGNFRRVGIIPNVIIEKWKNEFGVDVFKPADWPKVRALLNDPEWRYLRSSEGTI